MGVGGHYVDVIQKRERMLHLLKRLPRKIAVSRMATSPGAASLPSATVAGSYAAVIIIVPVPLQQAFELRRVYIQFVSRNYNLLRIGAADDAEELRAALLFAHLPALGDRCLLSRIASYYLIRRRRCVKLKRIVSMREIVSENSIFATPLLNYKLILWRIITVFKHNNK